MIPDEHTSYWAKRLDGMPDRLDLPADRSPPAVRSLRRVAWQFELAEDVVRGLCALSERTGVRMSIVLLAGFKLLLARYTRQDDLVVGTIAADGPGSATPRILLLRTDLSGDPTFVALVHRVRDTWRGAYEHRDAACESAEAARPVQIMTDFLPLVVDAGDLGRDGREPIAGLLPAPDLSLILKEGLHRIHGALEYDPDLFDRETIEALCDHFEAVLTRVIADQQARISQVKFLSARDRDKLLLQWNHTRCDFPEVCLHELFSDAARRVPDAIALTHHDRQVSYSELDRMSSQLAHHLGSSGVGQDDVVGLCIERSIDMVVALLAILKAGAAYLPLDPTYPPERLAFMAEDSGMRVVIAQDSKAAIFRSRCKVIGPAPDRDAMAIAQQSREAVRGIACPDNLAYVIYTSGSTGTPKGVMIQHRAIANYVQSIVMLLRLHETPRALLHTSICFDLALTVFFPTLIAGGELVLASNDTDVVALRKAILQHPSGLGAIKLTPTHLRLLQGLLDDGDRSELFSKIISGGERLTFDQLQFYRQRFPAAEIWNHYGPTETTVGCCVFPVRTHEAGFVPIGRPIANTKIYILDRTLEPVPIGAPGDLFVAGAGLAKGYLNRPELTAERFIDNPFEGGGAKMYRTGDLARYRRDGNIEFLGRADYQVKIRGYRIELGEVEAALHGHPRVDQAVVVVHNEANDYQRLVAYVVPKQPATDSASLRDYLRSRLPSYMVPSEVIVLTSFPRTPNGKIDRAALRTITSPAGPDRRPSTGTADLAVERPGAEEARASGSARSPRVRRKRSPRVVVAAMARDRDDSPSE